MTASRRGPENPYLDHYLEQLEHQKNHGTALFAALSHELQPWTDCFECLRNPTPGKKYVHHGVKKRFSWAVPNFAALETIEKYSPNGVVEIGAGGGYWAKLMREHGIDVIAYDPDPEGGISINGGGWHDGTRWSEVLEGDHTMAGWHPNRTLLMVWPSYGDPWTDEVLDHYTGDTVIYVGEGHGGCTGSDRMHQILGLGSGCWHWEDDCECDPDEEARFEEVDRVAIPQWCGLHDDLKVLGRF